MKQSRIILSLIILIILNITIFDSILASIELGVDKDYRVGKVTIEGNESLKTSQIRSLMETKPKSFISRILFWRKPPLLIVGELEKDISQITRKYQREGFLNVEVDAQVELTDVAKKTAVVKLIIEENQRVTIREVNLRFVNSAFDDHQAHLDRLIEDIRIQEGGYFRDEDLKHDIKAIIDYYDQNGFPNAAVEYSLNLSSDEQSVDVQLTIDSGEKAYFGEVNFEGLERTEQRLLGRLISFDDGEEYSPEKLSKTRNNLQSIGLFRFVSLNMRLDSDAEYMPVDIYVNEKNNITMDFGVGYGIEDKIRVYTEITKLRFLGGLRTGTIFLKHSSLEPINVNLTITQPAFPTVSSKVSLNPFYRQEEEPAYSIERLGVNTTLSHTLSERTSAFVAYSYEDIKLKSGTDDVPDELPNDTMQQEELYRKSTVSLGLFRDSSSPTFFPQRGTLISNIVTFSGLLDEADYPYWRNLSEVRYYQLIGSAMVIATRLKVGFIHSMKGNEFIPYEERFYAGGAFSVRGWQRAELGPENTDGEPVGGNSYLEGSIEFRFPLWRDLSGVTFIDYGNVWRDEFVQDITDLRYAAGGGLRYATPIGPIRLDLAVPVFEGRMPLQFFLSLGQTF